jgi:hypothetical protein
MSTLTMKIMRHGEIETIAADLSQPVQWGPCEWMDGALDTSGDYYGFDLDVTVSDNPLDPHVWWSVKASSLVSEWPELVDAGRVEILRGEAQAVEVGKFKAQAAARKAVRALVARQAA